MKGKDKFDWRAAVDAIFIVSGVLGVVVGLGVAFGVVTTQQINAFIQSAGLSSYWGFILAGFSAFGVAADLVVRRRR